MLSYGAVELWCSELVVGNYILTQLPGCLVGSLYAWVTRFNVKCTVYMLQEKKVIVHFFFYLLCRFTAPICCFKIPPGFWHISCNDDTMNWAKGLRFFVYPPLPPPLPPPNANSQPTHPPTSTHPINQPSPLCNDDRRRNCRSTRNA